MGIDRYLTICVLILVSLCVFTHSKIHRTKPNWNKSLNRQKTVTENSYVASSHEEQEDNSNSTQSENMVERLEIWCCSILGAVLVGLSGIFPLLVIPIEAGPQLKHGAAAAKLKLLLSFAVGGLLGDVFLHLLPEAWDHLDKESQGHDGHMKIGMWVIAGLMCFLIIEKMFAKENEHDHLDTESSKESTTDRRTDSAENTNGVKHRTKNKQAKSKHKTKNSNNKVKSDKSENSSVNSSQNTIKVSGYLNLAANVIDNFTHGLAVAGGFLVSMKVGLITTVAILLHEIPHEVGDFAILLRSGFDRWKAAKAQLLTATGGTVGALTALMADSAQAAGDSTVWILPFTSGGFLYIALVTVVPDLLEEKNPRESIKQTVCLISGIFVMYLVSLVH